MNGAGPSSDALEAPVRSSPRLAAAALAARGTSNGAGMERSNSGSSNSSSRLNAGATAERAESPSSSAAASSLQVPGTQAPIKVTPRRSVSFGPAVEEGSSDSRMASLTSEGQASLMGEARTATTGTGATDMARSDSAKRRARISSEVDDGGSGRTLVPVPSAASDNGTSTSAMDLASLAMGSRNPSTSGNSIASTSTPQALKPALKQNIQSKRLPPHGQYQHPDPLLRRLRLVDDKGQPINLRDHFKGVKVVAFYFSSQWAGQPLKEYHQTISELAREHPSELRVIYVSVDVDEQWYKAGVKGQPWVSMAWNDGSSLPSPGVTNATSPSVPKGDGSSLEPPPLHNSEDFLLAQELDIDESLAKTDTSGEAYLRPFSRVHLASKLNIIAAPTVCIYHLERQRMLDWNVRMARLDRTRRDETWSRWRQGEKAKQLGLVEALSQSPGTLLLLAFALLYWAMILIGGRDWNIIRRAIERADPNNGVAAPIHKLANGANNVVNQHVEF